MNTEGTKIEIELVTGTKRDIEFKDSGVLTQTETENEAAKETGRQ